MMEVSLKWYLVLCSVLVIGIYAKDELDLERAPCDNKINKCENGGTCVSRGNQKFCKCRKGTSGPFCETVDDCAARICGKSTDIDVFCMYDQVKESAVCLCKEIYSAFDRVEGMCRKTCYVDVDCGNGASCLRGGINEKENFTVGAYDKKFCRCLPGTGEAMCETVFSCDKEKDFCGKDSAVSCYYDAMDQRARCACPRQKQAFDDSSKTCKECDCGKQSVTCEYEDGEKRCSCKVGFYGADGSCKECNCGDQGVDCDLQSGVKVCTCKDGFLDVDGTCTECKCGKYSTGCSSKDGKKICECTTGFKQSGDQCESCNCRRNFIDCDFTNDGEIKCICEDGYVQINDICEEACSEEKPCQNGGTCAKGLCTCKNGTAGNFCQIIPVCDYDNPCPNTGGIKCSYDQTKEKAICKCPSKAEVYLEDEKKCKEICDYDDLVCENGGTCSKKGEGRVCECLKGTSGDFCQEIEKCESLLEVELFCGNHSHVFCSFNSSSLTPYCECSGENEEYNKETKNCTVTCNEKDRPCMNGGTCSGNRDGMFCRCKDGTFGDLCEKITKCDVWHEYVHFCGGGANVNCSFDPVREEAYCFCDSPSQKFNRQTKKCTITCDNSENLCINEGKCTKTDDGDFCQCGEGFSGDLCEIVDVCVGREPFCGSDKNTECVFDDGAQKVVCICNIAEKEFDYELKQCRDTCDEVSKLCKYGGSCFSDPSSPNRFCRCQKGFSGDFCEHVDRCDSLCGNENGVRCGYDERGENVACVCKDGLKRFDKVVKKCRVPCSEDNDCQNTAKCSWGGSTTFCRCPVGTSGDFCEAVDDCEDRKVDCGEGNGAICRYTPHLNNGIYGYCSCADEKKKYYDETKKCIYCSCGPLSWGCSLPDGRAWCHCDDGAYDSGNYCNDCDCGDYSDGCNYDKVLKEKVCQCKAGFSQIRDRCEVCDCGAGSKECKFISGEKICDCEKGFIQKDGFCQPACNETKPCRNGGRCVGGFCQCKQGTSGTLCQIVPDCDYGEICGGDEKVVCLFDEEREGAYCSCNGTGLMFDADSKTCVECNCEDKGVCLLENGKKKCICIPTYGFIRGKCEECKCGDQAESCSLIGGKVQCLCKKDFDVKDGICTKCGCGENSEGCTFEKDKITCKCKKGFSQHGTECQACDCGENGTCSIDKDGQTNCVCKAGYGLKAGKCVQKCSDDCKNGGSCKKEGEGSFCSCQRGTSGDLCDVIEDCENVFRDCKDDLGTCRYGVGQAKAYCECKERTQYDDMLKRCRKTCSDDVPCENEGKCENSICRCEKGTSGDLCSVVDGCTDLQDVCNAGEGICIYAPDEPNRAACGCEAEGFMFSKEKGGCQPIWCLENSCAASAACAFDAFSQTAYCTCSNNTAYYDHTGKSCNAIDQCLFGVACEKFEVCQNGECICPDYHQQTSEGCRPDLCSLHKCTYYKGASCKETDLINTVDCLCDGGRFYDGSKCLGGSCFLPGQWSSCYDGCPYNMEQTDTGCQAKDKDKICSKNCGKYGFCMKEGGQEVCQCLPKFAVSVNGSCVLNAAAVCASKRLTQDSSRCDCSGILKYAANGITCEKRTCTDEDVQEECRRDGAAFCQNNWDKPTVDSGAGYRCVCGPGYAKNANNVCTDKCKVDSYVSACAARGQICILDHLYDANCKCPPTTAWNETTQKCDTLNENVFMMQNLTVLKTKYTKVDGSVDRVMLNVDIVKAMNTVYQAKILDYAYLLSYSETSEVLICTVILQFKEPSEWDMQRYYYYKDLPLNCQSCSTIYLLPPLLLDKKSFNELTLRSLDFCSEHLRNNLCGPGSECRDKRCSCSKGYRSTEATVKVNDDFTLMRCEDIDECSERMDQCSKNNTCVNIPGDYFCSCKQGFKKLSDTFPYKYPRNKEACTDFCSPSPCVKGSCSVNDKGFDCRCEVGYSGSLCDKADLNLKKANNNSKVIGGVLGTLLAGFVVACLAAYYFKFYKRKQSLHYSESGILSSQLQAEDTELAERTTIPEITNLAFE